LNDSFEILETGFLKSLIYQGIDLIRLGKVKLFDGKKCDDNKHIR